MRISFVTLLVLSALAFVGPVFAVETPAPSEESAAPLVNPMGAGLVVPAGEAPSPVAADASIAFYSKPDLASEKLGALRATGSRIPYQTHVIVKSGPDPEWKATFFRRLFKRTAPIVEHQTPVSEFILSPQQRGIMIVAVEGSWLQTAQGWFQWTQAVANHARFIPWSELYQQASFEAFQLTNARTDRADLVPLGEVEFREENGEILPIKAPARFVLLETQPGTLKLRLTGTTCPKNPNPLVGEGKVGWVHLFAQSGAPQLLLQPEHCPEDTVKQGK